MATVRVTEIYDLSTQVGRMGIVGIHTPAFDAATTLWDGLFKQYQYVRLASCDVTVACASTLPADPLQIGTEAGSIAPQDIMNPILYKAVSNDSFNRVINRIYGIPGVPSEALGYALGSIDAGTLGGDSSTDADQFNMYYGLLADTDGWKKAMPQQGFAMKGLYPMVYQVVNTFGNQFQLGMAASSGNDLDNGAVVDDNGDIQATNNKAYTLRGPSMRMPRIPTKVVQGTTNGSVVSVIPPKTYVACFIVPPAKLNKFYYRMRVTWTLEFEELRPSTDYEAYTYLALAGMRSYGTDYDEQSKKLPNQTDAVDGDGVEIERIMVSGK